MRKTVFGQTNVSLPDGNRLRLTTFTFVSPTGVVIGSPPLRSATPAGLRLAVNEK